MNIKQAPLLVKYTVAYLYTGEPLYGELIYTRIDRSYKDYNLVMYVAHRVLYV
jgi:hypothetical protein